MIRPLHIYYGGQFMKKRTIITATTLVVIALAITSYLLSTQEEPISFEAEDCILNGVEKSQQTANFSGNGYITSFDQPEDALSMKIHAMPLRRECTS